MDSGKYVIVLTDGKKIYVDDLRCSIDKRFIEFLKGDKAYKIPRGKVRYAYDNLEELHTLEEWERICGRAETNFSKFLKKQKGEIWNI